MKGNTLRVRAVTVSGRRSVRKKGMLRLGLVWVWMTALAPGLPLVLAGCGSDMGTGATCTGACGCAGNTCSCNAGANCTLGPSLDAGIAPGALPSGTTYNCDSRNTCTTNCGPMCTSTCAGQSMCTGQCGASCSSTCAGDSTCSLSSGPGSTITCEGGSTCELTIQDGSTVRCSGDSTCIVILDGRATVECDGSSHCTVRCPRGGCTITCMGDSACTLECGTSGSACRGTCMMNSPEVCQPGMTCEVPACH